MATKNEQAILELIIKGEQSGNTIKALTSQSRALSGELKRLPMDSQRFVDQSKKLREVNARLKAIRDDVKGTGSAFGNMAKQLAGYFSIGAAIAFVGSKIRDAVRNQREFDKSLKNLSAITGATGKDLEFFKKKALEMSGSVEGGAKAVVEAYKLIGSAKPELLENKEALNQVTEAAILLAHASGLELPEAATRLTDALNQYGAPASQAVMYTDALAAAAKYGAAEVPEITEALLKFGTQAKSSNIDIYESTAAIELLAEKGIKGAEAGTNLRNIFTKMAAVDALPAEAIKRLDEAGVNMNILKDSTLPLNARLQELSKIQGDAAAITKVFKLENQAAGQILIENLPRLQQLTDQIHETGVAEEQAAKNLDTFDQAIIEAGNAWDNLVLSLTSGNVGEIIKTAVKMATAQLKQLSFALNNIGKSSEERQLEANEKLLDKFQQIKLKGIAKLTEEEKKAWAIREREELHNMVNRFKNSALHSEAEVKQEARKIERKRELLKALVGEEKKIEVEKKEVVVGLITQLQEEIEALTKSRLASTDRAEIASINKQIKSKQEQLDDLLGKEKKHNDKRLKLFEQLQKDMAALNAESGLFNSGDLEKEFATIIQAHDDMRKRIGENEMASAAQKKQMLLELETNTNLKIEAAGQKHLKEQEKLIEEALKSRKQLLQTAIQNELDAEAEKYDTQIAALLKLGQSTEGLEEAKQAALAEIRKKYADKEKEERDQLLADIFGATHSAREVELQSVKDHYDKLIEAAREAGLSTVELEQAKADKIREINKAATLEKVEMALEFAGQAANIMGSLAQVDRNHQQAEIDALDQNLNDALAKEQRQLDAKVINKKTYDQRVAKLESEADNKRRQILTEQDEAEKRASRFRIMLSSAEAIAKIWATTPEPITAGLRTTIALGVMGAQLAVVESAPVPKYAGGGFHEPAGFTSGENLYGSSTGQPFIAGEAGREYIVPNALLQQPMVANVVSMIEAMRTGRTFAQGGFTSTPSQSAAPASSGSASHSGSGSFEDLIAVIGRLNDNIEGGIGVNYDLFTKTMDGIDKARRSSAI